MENKQWYEFGIGLTTTGDWSAVTGSFDTNIGFGVGLEFSRNELSPKIGLILVWGWSGIGPSIGINANYYAQRKSFVFTPELGIQVIQKLHLTYGYQFGQVAEYESNSSANINNHRISLFITLPIIVRQ